MASRILKNGTHRITQGYSAGHKAVDLGPVAGREPVIAHSDGKVVFCQTGQKNNKGSRGNASYGNCIKLEHKEGYSTLYAHLKSVAVRWGDTVKQGQILGEMGNTGNSYGTHLHFELRQDNQHCDPTPYLNADLPPVTPLVRYKAFSSGWWPEVMDCHDEGADGYAGVQGRTMTALMARTNVGRLRYRVHLLGGDWLPWVIGYEDFAGVRGKPIDAVQMVLEEAEGYQVKYRVSPAASKGWYGWCTGLTDATGDGYAGVPGKAIDCIQICVVKEG